MSQKYTDICFRRSYWNIGLTSYIELFDFAATLIVTERFSLKSVKNSIRRSVKVDGKQVWRHPFQCEIVCSQIAIHIKDLRDKIQYTEYTHIYGYCVQLN